MTMKGCAPLVLLFIQFILTTWPARACLGGGGACCPPAMQCAPTLPPCSAASYGGPSLGGGGCGGGGCGAGGSFAAPAVAGSVASLGASGGAYHGQSAPVAISFNSGGGGPSYEGGGGGLYQVVGGGTSGGGIYPSVGIGSAVASGYGVNGAGFGGGSTSGGGGLTGAAPPPQNIGEPALPPPAGVQSGYNENPVETVRQLPAPASVAPAPAPVVVQSPAAQVPGGEVPYQQSSVDNAYEEIVSDHEGRVQPGNVDIGAAVENNEASIGTLEQTNGGGAAAAAGAGSASYQEQAAVPPGPIYSEQLSATAVSVSVPQAESQTVAAVAPQPQPQPQTFQESQLSSQQGSYESQEAAAPVPGGAGRVGNGGGVQIQEEIAQQAGYEEQGGGSSGGTGVALNPAPEPAVSLESNAGSAGIGYEEQSVAQQAEIAAPPPITPTPTQPSPVPAPAETVTFPESSAANVETANNIDVDSNGGGGGLAGYAGEETNAIVEPVSVETDASTCNDPQLKAIVEAALNEEHDNLDAARKIEAEASKRFGGRFNSIVSDSEFAYVNWYGKRNCQLRVRGRHSLTWED